MNKKAIYSLIFAGGLAIGGAGTGLYLKNQQQQQEHQDITLIHHSSPFEQMEKMRKEMDKYFESSMNDFSKVTYDTSTFGETIGDIKQDEDSKFVYYTIDLKGIDKNSIKTDVTGGQVIVSGSSSNIQAQEEKGMRSESYESFQRSFPVPGGVDPNKVQFETKEDKLVIKFPKVSVEDRPTV